MTIRSRHLTRDAYPINVVGCVILMVVRKRNPNKTSLDACSMDSLLRRFQVVGCSTLRRLPNDFFFFFSRFRAVIASGICCIQAAEFDSQREAACMHACMGHSLIAYALCQSFTYFAHHTHTHTHAVCFALQNDILIFSPFQWDEK